MSSQLSQPPKLELDSTQQSQQQLDGQYSQNMVDLIVHNLETREKSRDRSDTAESIDLTAPVISEEDRKIRELQMQIYYLQRDLDERNLAIQRLIDINRKLSDSVSAMSLELYRIHNDSAYLPIQHDSHPHSHLSSMKM